MKRRGWIVLIVLVPVILAAAAVAGRLAASRNSPRDVPILMYHRISDDGGKWCVPPEVFEEQMRFLREEGYVSILPADLAANRRWGNPLPARPVIITFDDGYLDTMVEAEPVLAKYGLRGIVYLVTDSVADDPARRRQFAGADCLTWPEVREIRRRGVLAFGGHSSDHIALPRLPDQPAAASRCREEIERAGGFTPDSFCYPYGMCRAESASAVREAGFSTGVICGDEVAAWGPGADPYRLPRVSVMGGRNRFTLARRSGGSSPDPVFDLEYEGVDMRVSPALRLFGPESALLWHDPLDLRTDRSYELRWPADAAAGDLRLRVEIWDRNRVLRLHSETFD